MRRLIISSLFFLTTSIAGSAEESWIAIATGSNSDWVYAYSAESSTKSEAEKDVMGRCRAAGRSCTYMNSWNFGCIYAVTGHDDDGRVYLGTGPDLTSAIKQCQKTGASCPEKQISQCVKQTNTTQPRVAAIPMAQAPGMDAPTENYRRPPASPQTRSERAAEPSAFEEQDAIRYYNNKQYELSKKVYAFLAKKATNLGLAEEGKRYYKAYIYSEANEAYQNGITAVNESNFKVADFNFENAASLFESVDDQYRASYARREAANARQRSK